MFFDTHAHLTLSKGLSIDDQLENAKDAGVSYILDPGLYADDLQPRLDKLGEKKNVFLGAAIAPHHHKRYIDNQELLQSDLDRMKKLITTTNATKKKIIAISEIGYEFFHFSDHYDCQKKIFDCQLDLAIDLDLPVFLHLRNGLGNGSFESAYQWAQELIKEKNGKVRGAVHCFSENYENAKKFLDLGFYISFSGIVTFKKSDELREVALKMPLEKMLSETDAPYLAPHPYRGKENQSAYVTLVNKQLAEVRGMQEEDLGKTLTENAVNLLQLEEDDL